MTVKHVPGKNSKEGEVVYLKDVVLVYPFVQETRLKHESDSLPEKEKRHYELVALISSEDREELEDKVLINKQIFEVNKDKNKMRKIKYPVKDKDGEPTAYAGYEGLHGINLTLNEYSKKGKKNKLVVVDADGQPIDCLVGNGSKGHIKLWGYRRDGLLNVQMKILKVTDLVSYEGGSGGGIEDDELGVKLSADDLAGGDADFDGIDEPDNDSDPDDDNDDF